MNTSQEQLRVGSAAKYLGEKWFIAHKENPADVMHRRFIRLDRINPMGQHETVELGRDAWDMIHELP